MAGKSKSGVHGVMMVRNEWDIVVLNLLHHLSIGLDCIHVADNGSTDGTAELLEEMSRHYRIRPVAAPGGFEQEQVTNSLIADARTDGARWIIPIDGDEFWDPGSHSLEEAMAECGEEEMGRRVTWVSYLTPSRERAARMGVVLQAGWIPRKMFPYEDKKVRQQAREGEIPISLLSPSGKCFLRADRDLLLEKGSHRWQGMPSDTPFSTKLLIRHVQFRHRGKYDERQEAGVRTMQSESYREGNSWHQVRLVGMSAAEIEREWLASSATDGAVHLGEKKYLLREDRALQKILYPHVERALKIYRTAGIDPRLDWTERFWRTGRTWHRLQRWIKKRLG